LHPFNARRSKNILKNKNIPSGELKTPIKIKNIKDACYLYFYSILYENPSNKIILVRKRDKRYK
jgi:hypothetical protein